MNILPKKSWHVRNKDNVERVRRDEENARLEEEKRLKRVALAEQEARTNLLRKRARAGRLTSSSEDLTAAISDASHSNAKQVAIRETQPVILFQKESGETQTGKNKEYEKEKKTEQEEYEKKLGILTYLGQGSVETQTEEEKPWYYKVPERNKTLVLQSGKEDGKSKEVDLKRKSSLDPCNSIPRKSKKYKKHKKEKSHHKSDNSMEVLRAKRLKREAKEKQRTAALLRSGGKSDEIIEEKSEINSSKQKYNSQYNPEFVRRKTYDRYSHK